MPAFFAIRARLNRCIKSVHPILALYRVEGDIRILYVYFSRHSYTSAQVVLIRDKPVVHFRVLAYKENFVKEDLELTDTENCKGDCYQE